MNNQKLLKTTGWILIVSTTLFINCVPSYSINDHLKKKLSDRINLLVLFTCTPKVKDNDIILRSLKNKNLSKGYFDKFRSCTPELIRNSTGIDSVDIKVVENFSFNNYKAFNIEQNKKIDIYFPDMKGIKQISDNMNIVLIFQEITIIVSDINERSSFSTYVEGYGMQPILTNSMVPYLISGGIFSLWDINDNKLIDYGKFIIKDPIDDISKMWITSFNNIIRESVLKTSLMQ
ncbi:MAG: hypothetical protein HND50_04060 [Calditrichaeota bacterium]|nr:hypothetical protein [Calditrichota bacterium]